MNLDITNSGHRETPLTNTTVLYVAAVDIPWYFNSQHSSQTLITSFRYFTHSVAVWWVVVLKCVSCIHPITDGFSFKRQVALWVQNQNTKMTFGKKRPATCNKSQTARSHQHPTADSLNTLCTSICRIKHTSREKCGQRETVWPDKSHTLVGTDFQCVNVSFSVWAHDAAEILPKLLLYTKTLTGSDNCLKPPRAAAHRLRFTYHCW